MDKKRAMEQLVQKLNKWSYEYYTLDDPSVSDTEYDVAYNYLLLLEKELDLVLPASPTNRIGDIVLDKFKKVNHKTHLWSLDKAQTKDEVQDFINRCNKFVNEYNRIHQDKLPTPQFVVSLKLDGLTLNSSFDNGELKQSASRGTGTQGEDITEQSKTIINLPKTIKYKKLINVHGEALMTKNAFNEYNNNLKEGEIPLKNLRNGAAGALRNLNVKETARRKLSVLFYDLSYTTEQFEDYSDTLEFMKEQGFSVVDYEICNSYKEVDKAIDRIGAKRESLQYDIDGVVISLNDTKTRELMGYTIKFPRHSIAFKFEAQETTTTLLDVEWNTGRTGKITPRAVIEPVELCGVTVSYATLNNIDDIKRKNVKIGGRVFARRSNDVIPEIMGNADDEGIEIQPPTHCPSCGSELIRDGVHYFCPNTLSCKPQLVKSIELFCSRECMNIEGLSIKTIEVLYEKGIVTKVIDIYSLSDHKAEIMKIDKMGEKKFNNLIRAIENSKVCKLENFIYGLGIEGIGKGSSKDLCKHFKNDLNKIMNATKQELLLVNDFGDTSSTNVYEYFHNQKNIDNINELLQYITFKEDKLKEVNTNGIFTGKKIYCTGTFANYKKEQLKSIVEKLGGEFTSGYAKSLDYLVVGSVKGSSKTTKAENDGVPVLSEEEFEQMIK